MRAKFRALTGPLFSGLALIFLLASAMPARAQESKNPYPSMFPLDQYLMERSAEIKLARSAAPDSVSREADVMVLGRHGYSTVAKGTNGFTCMVLRSWTAPSDDPEFWNPKIRSPICFNHAATKSYLPLVLRKTESLLAGRSKAETFKNLDLALDKKELPSIEVGSMCYMMSKQGYLNDRAGHWHPHLMFFVPIEDASAWGADVHGSPILSDQDKSGRVTIFMVPVGHWSDGSEAPAMKHG